MSKKERVSKLRQVLTVTAMELALALGISVRHVWQLNEKGKLPRPIRLGTSVMCSISEITNWVDNKCPDLKTWEAKKREDKISTSNCLLDQVAEILLNLQTGKYSSEQSESAGEVLEAILRRHYDGSRSHDDR